MRVSNGALALVEIGPSQPPLVGRSGRTLGNPPLSLVVRPVAFGERMTAVAPAQNPFIQFRLRYQDNAELFVREVLGFPTDDDIADGKDIYPWQREALAAYDRAASDRTHARISIRSGDGVGKTTLLA